MNSNRFKCEKHRVANLGVCDHETTDAVAMYGTPNGPLESTEIGRRMKYSRAMDGSRFADAVDSNGDVKAKLYQV